MTSPFEVQASHSHELAMSSADTSIGIVSAAKNDPAIGPVVRVTYPDCDGKVSAWLPVLQKNTIGMSNYSLPRLRERVLVQKLSNGREHGVVIGSVYSNSVSNPVESDPNNIGTTCDDGSTLHINPVQGNAAISMTQAIDIESGATIQILANGQINMRADGIININATGALNATSGVQVTVTAPMINLNGVTIDSSGNVTIPGTLTVVGNVTFDAGGTIATHLTNADGAGGGA